MHEQKNLILIPKNYPYQDKELKPDELNEETTKLERKSIIINIIAIILAALNGFQLKYILVKFPKHTINLTIMARTFFTALISLISMKAAGKSISNISTVEKKGWLFIRLHSLI